MSSEASISIDDSLGACSTQDSKDAATIILDGCHAQAIKAYIKTHVSEINLKIVKYQEVDSPAVDRYLFNVPLKSPNLVSRPELVDKITANLKLANEKENSLPMVVCGGLGGMGKSWLAIEFIYQYLNKYQNIFWFEADDSEVLKNSYVKLANALALSYNNEDDAIEVLKGWFCSFTNSLIIFNQAPDYHAIENYLPQWGCNVLVTSTYTEWQEEARVISIEEFTHEQARECINKYLGIKSNDKVVEHDQLILMFGHLPLALAQASAYIRKNRISIQRYLDLYGEDPCKILAGGDTKILPPDYHGKSVWNIWDNVIAEISKKSLFADRFLSLCSWLNPKDIPLILLKELADNAEINPNNESVNEAIVTLSRCSFITRDLKQQTLAMHCLLQQVIWLKQSRSVKLAFVKNSVKLFSHQLKNLEQRPYLSPHELFLICQLEIFITKLERWQIMLSAEDRIMIAIDYLLPILIKLNDCYANDVKLKESQQKLLLDERIRNLKLTISKHAMQLDRKLQLPRHTYYELMQKELARLGSQALADSWGSDKQLLHYLKQRFQGHAELALSSYVWNLMPSKEEQEICLEDSQFPLVPCLQDFLFKPAVKMFVVPLLLNRTHFAGLVFSKVHSAPYFEISYINPSGENPPSSGEDNEALRSIMTSLDEHLINAINRMRYYQGKRDCVDGDVGTVSNASIQLIKKLYPKEVSIGQIPFVFLSDKQQINGCDCAYIVGQMLAELGLNLSPSISRFNEQNPFLSIKAIAKARANFCDPEIVGIEYADLMIREQHLYRLGKAIAENENYAKEIRDFAKRIADDDVSFDTGILIEIKNLISRIDDIRNGLKEIPGILLIDKVMYYLQSSLIIKNIPKQKLREFNEKLLSPVFPEHGDVIFTLNKALREEGVSSVSRPMFASSATKTVMSLPSSTSSSFPSAYPWYTDADISTCVELKIKQNGGYKKDHHFLLSGIEHNRFPDNDGNHYFVLVTAAVDVQGLALPIDYFLDKARQPRNSLAMLLEHVFSHLDSLRSYHIDKEVFKEQLIRLIGTEISANDREDTLNKISKELAILEFNPERVRRRIRELEPRDRKDVFEEIEEVIRQPGDVHIKVLIPYNITQTHWLTMEIKIHKNDNAYKVALTIHDPYGKGKLSSDNFSQLCKTLEKQIKKYDLAAEIAFENVESTYVARQARGDGNSCGVIVVEDIVKRITGEALQQGQPYSNGAKELRLAHLQLINESLSESDKSRLRFLNRHHLVNKEQPNQSRVNNNYAEEIVTGVRLPLASRSSENNQSLLSAKPPQQIPEDVEFSSKRLWETLSSRSTPQILLQKNTAGRSINAFVINSLAKLMVIKTEVVIASERKAYFTSFWNVPQRNPNFTGREGLLKEIDSRMNQPHDSKNVKPVIITTCHGLGGVGKTQLAIEFVYRHLEDYEMVCWIPAENAGQIVTIYQELANDLRIPLPEKVKPEDIACYVKEWFLKHPKNLLVFDNAPDYKTIEKYVPQVGNYILITSRYTEWLEKGIEVDVFTIEEAREYVQKILREDVASKEIDDLALLLGRLPLALSQAAAYIKHNILKIDEYIKLYEKKKKELLSKELLPPGDHHAAVYVTWDITMEKINKESLLATKLLNICAYLYNEGIPAHLLKQYSESPTNNPSKETFDEAQGVLHSYSMIMVNNVNSAISLHSLIQTIILERTQQEQHKDWINCIATLYVNTNAISNLRNTTNTKVYTYLSDFDLNIALHTKKLQRLANRMGYGSVSLAQLCIYVTSVINDIEIIDGELTIAIKIADEASRLRYCALAHEARGMYIFLDNIEQSLFHFEQSLTLRQQLYIDQPCWELISSYTCLGAICLISREFEKARSHFENAFSLQFVSIKKIAFPHIYAHICLSGLLHSLKKLGDQTRASEIKAMMPKIMQMNLVAFKDLNQHLQSPDEIEQLLKDRIGIEYRRCLTLFMHTIHEAMEALENAEESNALPINATPASQRFDQNNDIEVSAEKYLDEVSETFKTLSTMLLQTEELQKIPRNADKQSEFEMLQTAAKFLVAASSMFNLRKVTAEPSDIKTSLESLMQMLPQFLTQFQEMKMKVNDRMGAQIPPEQKQMIDHFIGKLQSFFFMEDQPEQSKFDKKGKAICFDKYVIKRFQQSVSLILNSAEALKQVYRALNELNERFEFNNKINIAEVEKNLNESIIYPFNKILLAIHNHEITLINIQFIRDTQPEVFRENVRQSEGAQSMICNFWLKYKNDREELSNHLLELMNNLQTLTYEADISETDFQAIQVVFNISLLLLPKYDAFVTTLESLKNGIQLFHYITSHFPSKNELKQFCERESIDLSVQPKALAINADVVVQYFQSVKKLLHSTEELKTHLMNKKNSSLIKNAAEKICEPSVTGMDVLKTSFSQLIKDDAETTGQVLLLMKLSSLKDPLQKGQLEQQFQNITKIIILMEQFSLMLQILRKRFLNIEVVQMINAMRNLNNDEKAILNHQINEVFQLLQFFDRCIFYYEEISKNSRIACMIITQFPSKIVLEQFISAKYPVSKKENTLVLKESFQNRIARFTHKLDKEGTLSSTEFELLQMAKAASIRFEELNEKAALAYKQNDLSAAIEYYEATAAITADPNVYHNLGVFYDILSYQNQQINNQPAILRLSNIADDMFKKSLERLPHAGNLSAYANFLYRRNRYTESQTYLSMAIQFRDKTQVLTFSMIDRYLYTANLQVIIEKHGTLSIAAFMFAYFLLIDCYYRQENLERANATLVEFIQEVDQTNEGFCYDLLAQSCYLLGHSLAKDYEAKANYLYGCDYLKQGEVDKAIRCYERSVSMATGFAEAYHNLACLYHVRSDYNQAEQYFRTTINLKPSGSSYCDYALLLFERGKYVSAIENFLIVIRLGSDGSKLIYSKLEQKFFDNHLQQEITEKSFFEIEPFFIAHYWLIQSLYQLSDLDLLEFFLNKFVELVQKFPTPIHYRMLSYIYRLIEDIERADYYYAIALSPDLIKPAITKHDNFQLYQQDLAKLNELIEKRATYLRFCVLSHTYALIGEGEKAEECTALALSLEPTAEDATNASTYKHMAEMSKKSNITFFANKEMDVTTAEPIIEKQLDLKLFLQHAKVSMGSGQNGDKVQIIFINHKLVQQFVDALHKIGISNLTMRDGPRKPRMDIDNVNEEDECVIILSADEYNKVMDDKDAYAKLISSGVQNAITCRS